MPEQEAHVAVLVTRTDSEHVRVNVLSSDDLVLPTAWLYCKPLVQNSIAAKKVSCTYCGALDLHA